MDPIHFLFQNFNIFLDISLSIRRSFNHYQEIKLIVYQLRDFIRLFQHIGACIFVREYLKFSDFKLLFNVLQFRLYLILFVCLLANLLNHTPILVKLVVNQFVEIQITSLIHVFFPFFRFFGLTPNIQYLTKNLLPMCDWFFDILI